jgi:succinate-semialdehyde dehydrogenase/glutarate-semialdehyde dehydrogenase
MKMSSISTINPATETLIETYAVMDQETVNDIIESMHEAQMLWAMSDFSLRRHCFSAMAKLLLKHKTEYATLITNEMGKPITQAIAEIEKCSKLCDFYVAQGEHFLKPELIQTEFYKSYRTYRPMGIIFAIMPWNFPFWQVMRFAVPNLMGGNAALLKHAPNSTGTSLLIETLFLEAGFPKNLFRSLIIDVNLAPFVIQHPQVAGVTLTGSNVAGKAVAREAGAALKKVVLELGGSDPYLILEDADIERAAEQCVISRFNNAGQVCVAAKRMIVVEKVKALFEKAVLKKAEAYTMGNPHVQAVILGPMARADLRDKLHDQVERSIAAGATCLLGGKIPEGVGYYYPATVLTDVTEDSPAFDEEIFGPVICIISAKNEAEAIRLANRTEFGLGAAVFTEDLARGEHIAHFQIESGVCGVNTLIASDPRLPFGGIKQSGFGRELSAEGIHEFMNVKTVVVQK